MIEALLGCGYLRSLSLHAKIYNVPLPASDEDFAFSVYHADDTKYLEVLDLESSDPPKIQKLGGKEGEIDFAMIIQGFNIWCEVSRFVSSGANREEAPAQIEGASNTDSFWSRSLVALESWRATQPPRMHFSIAESHLQAFISRKQGERYALVNLIYFLTTIFLYREHIPLPMFRNPKQMEESESAFFREGVPTDWWKESAKVLSRSACSIIEMMKKLTSQGIDLQVPFTCYCVFNATTVLSFVKRWSAMDCEQEGAPEFFDWGFEWLSRASDTWEVARAWKATLMKIESSYGSPQPGLEGSAQLQAGMESLSNLPLAAGWHGFTRQLELDQDTTSGGNLFAQQDLTTLGDFSFPAQPDLPWLSMGDISLDYGLMADAQYDITGVPVNFHQSRVPED
jgi:hypothetical protein